MNKLDRIFECNIKLLENWSKLDDFDKMKQEILDMFEGMINEYVDANQTEAYIYIPRLKDDLKQKIQQGDNQ